MSFWIENAYASVWSVELQDKVAMVNLSTSRKDKDGEYQNSSWGKYNRFVGTARNKADNLMNLIPADGKPVRIKILKAVMSNEPYLKDGAKVYPKWPQLAVFDFEFSDFPNAGASAEEDDEDDLPF